MKNKGTITLLIVLVFGASIVIATEINSSLFSPPPPTIPKQIYAPTIPPADQRVVCIVFDDGWKSQLNALPILDRLGFNATFAVVTSYAGYPAYLSWNDIATVAQSGNDIESHTDTHADLSTLDNATLYSELAKSQQALRSKGYAANILVYPYGDAADNQTVRDAVAQYYLVARGTDDGVCNLTSLDRYNINSFGIYNDTSLEEFASYVNVSQGSAVTVLYYHQISDEIDATAVTQGMFEAQMQYLKDNNFTVETMSQLLLKNQP